jgi:hypothetical protein
LFSLSAATKTLGEKRCLEVSALRMQKVFNPNLSSL